jgi:hypothetical protein
MKHRKPDGRPYLIPKWPGVRNPRFDVSELMRSLVKAGFGDRR